MRRGRRQNSKKANRAQRLPLRQDRFLKVMTSDPLSQPYYLTLTELAFNYAVYGGVGYWAAGTPGVCVGWGLITARYAYLIWVAISRPPTISSSGEELRRPSEEPPM